jgi:hypothetical protein
MTPDRMPRVPAANLLARDGLPALWRAARGDGAGDSGETG